MPVEGPQTPADAEDFEPSWNETTSASGITVSPDAAAVPPESRGDFADEIVRLQALIEALSQKLEWRSPYITGR